MRIPDFLCLLATVTFLWSSFILFLGLFRPAKKHPKADRHLRFAAVICARNEEPVVRLPVESVRAADYPADRLRVLVLADNCTDKTAAVARAAGAEVWEKTTPSTCKGDVLAWGLARLQAEGDVDAVAVFDADNRVSSGWFTAMNDALLDGEMVVTGRRQASNARAGVIAGWYAVYWSLMNELSNRIRTNLGLSGKLNGTGFAFLATVLGAAGWRTHTLVEDVEFTVQVNLAGGRIAYVPAAEYADEQPVALRPMWRQLMRWTTGGWQVLRRYSFAWLKAFVRHPSFRLFDVYFVLLTGLSLSFVFLFTVVGLGLRIVTALASVSAGPLSGGLFGGALVLTALSGQTAVSLSPAKSRPTLVAVLTFPVFAFILSLSVLVSLVRPTRRWTPIQHIGAASSGE